MDVRDMICWALGFFLMYLDGGGISKEVEDISGYDFDRFNEGSDVDASLAAVSSRHLICAVIC